MHAGVIDFDSLPARIDCFRVDIMQVKSCLDQPLTGENTLANYITGSQSTLFLFHEAGSKDSMALQF